MEKTMKTIFLISTLVMAPLGFTSYHGSGESGSSSSGSSSGNSSGGGYGGSDALAIAGAIALIGGLAYYFTRDSKDEDKETNALIYQGSHESKKFEIDFKNYEQKNKFGSFYSSGLAEPQSNFKINFKYKLQ